MLDIKFIRENPDKVREALYWRNDHKAPLDELLKADEEHRVVLTELEDLRRQRKDISKLGKDAAEAGRKLRDQIKEVEEKESALSEQIRTMILQFPNIPQDTVPKGLSEDDFVIERYSGEVKELGFEALPHWDLAEKLGIIDFERGVKLSGTRFYILKGLGARLQRAVIWLMLDRHTNRHGYTEIYPPYMVKRDIMTASGNLPKFADNLYHDDEDDMWFVPTAEVPLTSLHADEILSAEDLPIHYAAYTACFRREKMSAGKDTRGIKRGHQFDKVELYKLCKPETSNDELFSMIKDVTDILDDLGLVYRLKALSTADISFSSSKTYDIEVWAPGCKEWLEVSSCSNCRDFQARRANIRFRPTPDSKPEFVHTLNGSGLALPRVMIAIMENYQTKDGGIRIPEALQQFMCTDEIRPK
jgi:seryl-tRNA synthetase